MSDENSPNTPLAGFLSNLMLIGSPIALVAMLGFLGVFFIGRMGDGSREKKPEAAPAVAAAAPAGEAAATPAAAPAQAEGGAGAEIDPAVLEMGKSNFVTCAACHGMDGKGLPVGPAKMAPSFIGSELLLGDPDGPILAVLKGIAKETTDYMGVMAPLGAALSDEQIAAVLTYVRNLDSNHAPPVTADQVAAARAKFADVNAPAGVKRAEIPAILKAHQ